MGSAGESRAGPGQPHAIDSVVVAEARSVGVSPGDTVVVGVSGGPDSCSLYLALRHASQLLGFRVHAAHLIHDFRGQEMYDDADFVRNLCADVSLTVDEVDVAAHQQETGESSFEQAARSLRYKFLGSVAQSVGARYAAVAHTADDQAETVLLHIARGSGVHGLRGMSKLARWPTPQQSPDLRVWRPLLDVRRADTIGYCRERGVEYRDDSTNYMSDFARNRVRLHLMPALGEQLNPRMVEALVRLSRISGIQTDYLEERVDDVWAAIAPRDAQQSGITRLRRQELARLHPALLPLVLRRAWGYLTGNNRRLTEGHLAALSGIAIANGSSKFLALPGGYIARTGSEWLELLSESDIEECPYPTLPGPFRITLPWGPIAVGVTKRGEWEVTASKVRLRPGASLDTGEPLSVYMSAEALAEGATVRTWEAGDRMQPLGMSGRRKLKDLFGDSGVPRDWRCRIPIVVASRGIAWAAGVRLADWASVRFQGDEPVEAILVEFDRLEPSVSDSGDHSSAT